MRDTFKATLFLTFFLISSFLFVPQVSADGAIFLYDPDIFLWRVQNEDRQLCAINHENGKQNMILAVDVIDLEGDKAVWMFPVPSEPGETEIDIIKGFPELYGYDILENKNEMVSGHFIVMRLTQVYTVPTLFFLIISQGMFGATLPGEGKGITVHEHIERMGLTTELVTAEDGDAFYSYLTGKGFDIPPGAKPILDEYTGEKYTFVVSWISDVELFKNESEPEDYFRGMTNTIGVSVSFPTDKIYFPMKPTSVYGNREIPILVYIIGLVTPELYPEIKQHTQVNYFQDRYYNVPDGLSNFFNGKERIEDLKYTKIKVEAPSNALTKDLWVNESVPTDILKADFINTNMWWWGIIIFIVSSCLASMLAGMIIYRKDKPDVMKFALFGLSNFITLIGFALLAYIIVIRKKFTGAGKAEMKDVKPGKSIKTAAITALVLTVLFSSPLFILTFPYLGLYAFMMILPIINFFVIIFLLILPFVHIFYRDRRLFKFIFLFSLLFLAITLPFELIFIFMV